MLTTVRRPSATLEPGTGLRRPERLSEQAGVVPAPSTRTGTGTGTGTVAAVSLIAVLCMIGLAMVLSASSVQSIRQYGSPWHFFERQGIWLLFGLVGFGIATRVPTRTWRKLARPAMVVTTLMLLLVLLHGRSGGGASRWLGTSSFQIQPSELAKLAMLLFVADVLDRRSGKGTWMYRLGPVLVSVVVLGALIMKQPDMGTTVVVCCIALAMMFAAGAPVRALSALAVGGGAAGILLSISSRYRYERFMSFLHPFDSATTNGYQSVQALLALGGGRLFGSGLGQSTASWGFLPNQYTDFIFAVIGQETGLIGSSIVTGLFAALAAVGTRIACRASSRFDSLLAAGVTAWLVAQAIINIGAVVGVLPVTGVPLPFVSYGGTSLVITLFAAGLLVNVARHSVPGEAVATPVVTSPMPGHR